MTQMETLVVVAHHRNQYYSGGRTRDLARGRFGSPPSGGLREINCRTFESGTGILPSPRKSCATPVMKRALASSFSLKTPPPSPSRSLPVNFHSEGKKNPKKSAMSSAIAIPFNLKAEVFPRKDDSLNDGFHFSELWAGPAYSNSPPPSSLPIPKFSLKPKRTVSLDLPKSVSVIDLPPLAKSAPASPTLRDRSLSPEVLFGNTDCATQTLRRILNLEITD